MFYDWPGETEEWYKNIREPGYQVEADAGNLEYDIYTVNCTAVAFGI